MSKFIIVHGMTDRMEESIGNYLETNLSEFGEVVRPQCKILSEGITFEAWEKEFEKYISHFGSDTTIIAHSLGTFFIPKYMKKNNLQAKAYISISGAYVKQVAKGFEFLIPFLNDNDDFEYMKNTVKSRYSLYSDHDHYFSDEQLCEYTKQIDAVDMFVPGKGHFSKTLGVKEVPEVMEVVSNIEKQNIKQEQA